MPAILTVSCSLEKKEKKAAEALAKEEKALEELQERMRGATSELHVALESRQRELLPHSKEVQECKNAIALATQELNLLQVCLPFSPSLCPLCLVPLTKCPPSFLSC
jgi:hypothetical protein